MTLEIIIALIVGIVAFLVLVAIWYLVFVPSKRKTYLPVITWYRPFIR